MAAVTNAQETLRFGISYSGEGCRQLWNGILKKCLASWIQQKYLGWELLWTSVKHFCILQQPKGIQNGSIGKCFTLILLGLNRDFSFINGCSPQPGAGKAFSCAARSPQLQHTDARAKIHSIPHHKTAQFSNVHSNSWSFILLFPLATAPRVHRKGRLTLLHYT